jgi:benzoate/toluate 1,2-dioxygenase subunit beta
MPDAPVSGDSRAEVLAEVEAFLFKEAELLDAREFDAWLELFAEDGIYWVPSGSDDGDPKRRVSVAYDSVSRLRERVWRLHSGVAHAQEPPSRTTRILSNVMAEPDGELVRVGSAFVLHEFRRGRLHAHAGRYRHELRRTDGRLAIAMKKVELVNNDGYLGNLSILL